MAYATRADLYRYGLQRGEIANPARLCASALAATDMFELDGHGFETGQAVVFRAESGGNLPAPIVAGTTYQALRMNESMFMVGGASSPIDLTSDGVHVLVATPLPVDEVLEFYSSFVDGFLPAHLVPLEPPYPITVTALVAELAANKLLRIAGQSSQSMTEFEVAAKAQLERWAKGLPLRDAMATASANLAYAENVAADPRGWGSGGTLI